MLQGYTFKENHCNKCGMPMMERNSRADCGVCPALIKSREADEARRTRQEAKVLQETKALQEVQEERLKEQESKAL
jgi:uncharacterized Zn finger protein (UPF0148 family)